MKKKARSNKIDVTDTSHKAKGSIRTKITLCLMAIIAFILVLSCILSVSFIKKYYYNELERKLRHIYKACNNAYNEDDTCDTEKLYSIFENGNDAMLFILDDINFEIYTTVNRKSPVYENLRYTAVRLQTEKIENQYEDGGNAAVQGENGKKIWTQITKDHDASQEYFDLMGYLDNGIVIVIRISVARVDSTIRSTIKYFMFILITTAVIGCVLMYFVSNAFAKPIKHLANVAKRMTDLDFEARIENPSNDEIGELAVHMNQLSHKLNETLTELKSTNSKLQTELNEKIKIDEMRKEFLSHVSHELKTPIALVQGYAEGLRDNINDDEDSKNFYCDVIMDESMKMNKLVKQLLDLNEIEFGKDTLTKERFDCIDLISNVLSSSGILLNERDVNVEFQDTEPVYVYADEFRIERVFTNYLTNAIHYAGETGQVKVWTEKLMYDKQVVLDDKVNIMGNLRVYVYNEGPNIPEDELEKIFIKFYKVDKARTREYGGSGIGLSIVAATMQAHKKCYGVYNVKDGVVFYFDLDICEEEGNTI